MEKPSEQELLTGARAWDQVLLGQIYDYYSPGIYRYAMRLLGDQNLAEDCVAETFTRFLSALQAGKGPKQYLMAYLYRIAHNWISDHYRRNGRKPLELDDPQRFSEQAQPKSTALDLSEQQQLRNALLSLTPAQMQVISLRFLEGWENDQVAAALRKPVTAVKALQYRGLRRLRQLLNQEEKKQDEI